MEYRIIFFMINQRVDQLFKGKDMLFIISIIILINCSTLAMEHDAGESSGGPSLLSGSGFSVLHERIAAATQVPRNKGEALTVLTGAQTVIPASFDAQKKQRLFKYLAHNNKPVGAALRILAHHVGEHVTIENLEAMKHHVFDHVPYDWRDMVKKRYLVWPPEEKWWLSYPQRYSVHSADEVAVSPDTTWIAMAASLLEDDKTAPRNKCIVLLNRLTQKKRHLLLADDASGFASLRFSPDSKKLGVHLIDSICRGGPFFVVSLDKPDEVKPVDEWPTFLRNHHCSIPKRVGFSNDLSDVFLPDDNLSFPSGVRAYQGYVTTADENGEGDIYFNDGSMPFVAFLNSMYHTNPKYLCLSKDRRNVAVQFKGAKEGIRIYAKRREGAYVCEHELEKSSVTMFRFSDDSSVLFGCQSGNRPFFYNLNTKESKTFFGSKDMELHDLKEHPYFNVVLLYMRLKGIQESYISYLWDLDNGDVKKISNTTRMHNPTILTWNDETSSFYVATRGRAWKDVAGLRHYYHNGDSLLFLQAAYKALKEGDPQKLQVLSQHYHCTWDIEKLIKHVREHGPLKTDEEKGECSLM